MNVLVIDVGGTHVKILASGEKEREIDLADPDGPADGIERQNDWPMAGTMTVVSIGYPGPGCA